MELRLFSCPSRPFLSHLSSLVSSLSSLAFPHACSLLLAPYSLPAVPVYLCRAKRVCGLCGKDRFGRLGPRRVSKGFCHRDHRIGLTPDTESRRRSWTYFLPAVPVCLYPPSLSVCTRRPCLFVSREARLWSLWQRSIWPSGAPKSGN